MSFLPFLPLLVPGIGGLSGPDTRVFCYTGEGWQQNGAVHEGSFQDSIVSALCAARCNSSQPQAPGAVHQRHPRRRVGRRGEARCDVPVRNYIDKMDLDFAVFQINVGDGDGAEIIFNYNHKRISISIFPGPEIHDQSDKHRQPTEGYLIRLLERAVYGDINVEYEEVIDEFFEIIDDAGRTAFPQRTSPRPVPEPAQDLHSALFPETSFFRLLTTSGKVSLIPISSREANTCPEAIVDRDIYIDLEINAGLTQYSSKEILIEEAFVHGGGHTVCQVLVDGKVMLCKASNTGLTNLSLERELEKLQKIQESCLPSIRVPPLLGYVVHPEAGRILGFLRELVPGRCLREIDIPSTPEERRRKWASQLCETVNQLHEIGVIWGDGKARNVIIDIDDDAWLIDLGGGWTEGWIDEKLADTVEGDEQAVKRIMQFLGVQ